VFHGEIAYDGFTFFRDFGVEFFRRYQRLTVPPGQVEFFLPVIPLGLVTHGAGQSVLGTCLFSEVFPFLLFLNLLLQLEETVDCEAEQSFDSPEFLWPILHWPRVLHDVEFDPVRAADFETESSIAHAWLVERPLTVGIGSGSGGRLIG
jgi:hypothetical protein